MERREGHIISARRRKGDGDEDEGGEREEEKERTTYLDLLGSQTWFSREEKLRDSMRGKGGSHLRGGKEGEGGRERGGRGREMELGGKNKIESSPVVKSFRLFQFFVQSLRKGPWKDIDSSLIKKLCFAPPSLPS